MQEGRSAFKILTGKSHLRRPMRRLEDIVKIELKEIGVSTVNWID